MLSGTMKAGKRGRIIAFLARQRLHAIVGMTAGNRCGTGASRRSSAQSILICLWRPDAGPNDSVACRGAKPDQVDRECARAARLPREIDQGDLGKGTGHDELPVGEI
jgi:hypothetical protein